MRREGDRDAISNQAEVCVSLSTQFAAQRKLGCYLRLRILEAAGGSIYKVASTRIQQSASSTPQFPLLVVCSPPQRVHYHEYELVELRGRGGSIFRDAVVLREALENWLVWEETGRKRQNSGGGQRIGGEEQQCREERAISTRRHFRARQLGSVA